MSANEQLGPGAEFDAIRGLLAIWGSRAVGIGDDAAIAQVPRGDSLIASVDASIENRHFKADWLTPREIGYRAVTAALSDLAAMAARPVGVLISLAIPDDWRDRLEEIALGIGDAVERAETHILGGNMSAASELSITTTVFGGAFAPLTRAGARPGDHVYITGRLGGPASALERLLRGENPGEYRERFARPVARLGEARWLASQGASAAIDISDGLVSDLRHVAHASGAAIELDVSSVPLFPGVDIDVALRSGEEYELVVTSPNALDVAVFEARFALPLTRIGRVLEGPPGVVSVGGVAVANASGHDHFSR